MSIMSDKEVQEGLLALTVYSKSNQSSKMQFQTSKLFKILSSLNTLNSNI